MGGAQHRQEWWSMAAGMLERQADQKVSYMIYRGISISFSRLLEALG